MSEDETRALTEALTKEQAAFSERLLAEALRRREASEAYWEQIRRSNVRAGRRALARATGEGT